MFKSLYIDKLTQAFTVKEPQQLLEFLFDNKVKKSKSATQSVLKRKLVLVNGKLVTQYDFLLKKGDRVEIMKLDQSKKEKRLKGLSIVYEDAHIIVIDKHSGLLSVGTEKEPFNNAFNIVGQYVKQRAKHEQLFVVQRVEREISGLMFFAKSLEAQSKFKKNWDYQVPKMQYRGVVQGVMPQAKGTIRSWLTENKNYQVFSNANNNGGIEAITDYKVIQSNEKYSLVDFELKTRHRNQVRAQMHQLSVPIVGDKTYGAKSNPLKRCLLHISELSIRHIANGKILTFNSDLPRVALKLVQEP